MCFRVITGEGAVHTVFDPLVESFSLGRLWNEARHNGRACLCLFGIRSVVVVVVVVPMGSSMVAPKVVEFRRRQESSRVRDGGDGGTHQRTDGDGGIHRLRLCRGSFHLLRRARHDPDASRAPAVGLWFGE